MKSLPSVLVLVLVLVLAGCSSTPGEGDTREPTAAKPGSDSAAVSSASRSRPGVDQTSFDPEHPLTLDSAVELAVASALNAKSFKARLEAARGAAVAASTWPNPTLEYTLEDIGLVSDHYRQSQHQELISYPILAFWTKFLENDVAEAELARATASIEDDKRQLRLTVGQTFLELLASDEAVRNLTETATIASKLAEAATTRARVGDASALDKRRAQTEALEARRDLANAVLKRETDGIAFALALGAERPVPVTLAPGWPLELPADVAVVGSESAARLVETAMAARPDLKEAEAVLLRANKSVELEVRKTVPLQTVTVGTGARQGPQGNGGTLLVGTTLPLFDWNGGNKTRARAELEQAVVDLERTRRQIAFDVEASVATFAYARRALEEFTRPIAKARDEALEDTRRLFTAGEVGYVELLQSQRDAVAARRELIDAEKDAAVARWKLLVALGR